MYTVYILECTDGSLYTGITTDVERRFEEHKAGTASKYTRVHGAKKIVYTEQAADRGAATQREIAIKKLSRSDKLNLIESTRK